MKEDFVHSCLAKLKLMESRVGANVGYRTLQADDFPLPYGLQDATERIARFLDLSNLTFKVTLRHQAENVGGHINLNRYQDSLVFVEISEDVALEPGATLATLAHEVTHAYLHKHKISCEKDPLEE